MVRNMMADLTMRVMFATGNSIYTIPVGCLVEHDVIWRPMGDKDGSIRHVLRVPEWLRIINDRRFKPKSRP